MKIIKMIRVGCLFLFVFFCLSSAAEAQNVRYSFNGKEFRKKQEVGGKVEQLSLCADVAGMDKLNIPQLQDIDLIYVSPDEKYFTFQVFYRGQAFYFLGDIRNCKVVREFIVDKEYQQIDYAAVFLPLSGKLLISWHVIDGAGKDFWRTIEYSGEEYKNMRILKNIEIPTRSSAGGGYSYFYKYSKDEKYLVTVDKNTLAASIYSVSDDEKISSFNVMDFKKRGFITGEYAPAIQDGLLLYNFDTDKGTEINVFDYHIKKLMNKIEIPEKGIASFASDGEKIVVTTFPDLKTMKKDVVVYDRKTEKKIGRASLDAFSQVENLSTDGKQIIYKKNKKEMRADIDNHI